MRADIDFAIAEAQTSYGKIGVKVWICKGEIYGKRDLSPNIGASATGTAAKTMGGGERRERGDRGGDRGGRGGRGGNRGGGNRGGGGGRGPKKD